MVSFTPQPTFSQRKDPSSDWIGGYMGPRDSVDVVAKRELLLHRESNPGCPARSVVSMLTELPSLMLSIILGNKGKIEKITE